MSENKSLAMTHKEQQLQNLVTGAAVSIEAAQDCLNSLSMESFTQNGIERVIVRSTDGKVLLDDNAILEHLKEVRPSYMSNGSIAGVTATAGAGTTENLSPMYIDELAAKVESGEIEQLTPEQKSNVRKLMNQKDKLGVAKSFGTKANFEYYRIFRKAGGLI
jgi:hypothetical protein